jgi:hypothetical protein
MIGEIVDITVGYGSRCLRRLGVGDVTLEAAVTVGGADIGAEGGHRTFVEHSSGEVIRYHQILQWIVDEHHYLIRYLSVFNLQTQRKIPSRW